MRVRIRSSLVLAGALVSAGCDQDLGDYSVEGVEFVSELPFREHDWPPARYIVIDLTSHFDLAAVGDPVHAIHIFADYCPLEDDHGLIAFGPLDPAGDRLPSAHSAARHPNGSYRYQVALVPAHPMPEVDYAPGSWPPEYNILRDAKDVCLRIVGMDHHNIYARSSVIRVPFERIARASTSEGN